MKIVLNPDKELVEEINKKLEENRKEYGYKYCPSIEPELWTDDEDICICEPFIRNNELGKCWCGKYIKTEL